MPYSPGAVAGPPGPPGPPTIIQDEGVPLAGAPHTTINFVGAGVTAINAGFGVAMVSIPGGGGALAIPLNEIVFGTGPSVTSDPDFTFDTATSAFYVNTVDGVNPSVSIAAPGRVGIFSAGGSGAGIASGDITIQTGGVTDGNTGTIRLTPGVPGGTDRGAGEILAIIPNSTGAANGSQINLQAGSSVNAGTLGGRARLAAGASISGTGGLALIEGGNSGDVGGNVEINAGDSTNAAGSVVVTGGDSTADVGGEVMITAGNGPNDGGDVTLTGGNGTGANTNGGDVQSVGGTGTGTGPGGAVTLEGGTPGATGIGGGITLTGGLGGATSGDGGTIALVAGNAQTDGTGGFVTLDGGDGVLNGSGGSLTITGGDAGAAGSDGGGIAIQGGVGGLFGGGVALLGSFGTIIGGELIFVAGDSDGTGGGFNALTGNSLTEGDGGDFSFTAGNAAGVGNNDGGSFTFTPGTGVNAGVDGYIDLAFQPTSELRLSTDPGTAGQVVTSQGPLLPPVWAAPPSILSAGGFDLGAAANTRILPFGFDATAVNANDPKSMVVPYDGVIDRLYARHNLANGNGNAVVYTLMVNGVGTALVVSLATGAVGQNSDLVDSVAVVQGDVIQMRAVKAVAIGSGVLEAFTTMRFRPSAV